MLALLWDLVFNVVGQAVLEVAFLLVTAPFEGRGHRIEVLGYPVLGLALGAGSLWVWPEPWVQDPTLALVGLVAAPLALGSGMVGLGLLFARRGHAVRRSNAFACGALLALAFAGVRWVFFSWI